MAKQRTLKRTTDKRGRVLYHRWSDLAIRWFRIGREEADLMLATGQAVLRNDFMRRAGT